MKQAKIVIPIYRQAINLISGDKQEVLNYLNGVYRTSYSYEWLKDMQAACYNINNDIWIFIDLSDISIPVLSHELNHATFELMEMLGLDIKDQEAFCYLQEFMLHETLKFIPVKIIRIDE